jgi:phosphoglycolate phosphatase-like HAD superfamily hydrolase
VNGIKEAIDEIRKAGYEVVVVSSRASSEAGKKAIDAYLDLYEIRVDDVKWEKVPAICYIDDRAICFQGDPSTLLLQIRSFKPWHKK